MIETVECEGAKYCFSSILGTTVDRRHENILPVIVDYTHSRSVMINCDCLGDCLNESSAYLETAKNNNILWEWTCCHISGISKINIKMIIYCCVRGKWFGWKQNIAFATLNNFVRRKCKCRNVRKACAIQHVVVPIERWFLADPAAPSFPQHTHILHPKKTLLFYNCETQKIAPT